MSSCCLLFGPRPPSFAAAFSSRQLVDSCKFRLMSSLSSSLPTKWSDVLADTLSSSSSSTKSFANNVFPPLTSTSHKGSHGRIAIFGGSEKYTGAPYYAAQSALNTGVDLVTIFCAKEASIPIKCYRYVVRDYKCMIYVYYIEKDVCSLICISYYVCVSLKKSRADGTKCIFSRRIECIA